jgi:uncharacterized membrane protein YphA (DoxX/SURF4 family)
MDYSKPTAVSSAGLALRDAGLFVLRWCAGITLLSFHAWQEGVRGWRHVWQKEAWPWAVEVAERGFPLPETVSAISVTAAIVCSVLLLPGLLCRLSASLLLAGSLVGLFLYGQLPEIAERLALYAGVYAVLVLCGPGRLSLDHLFAGKRFPRR